ncbi:MAG: hypothetical protein QW500_02605 [Candidatus Micrarchaeia archaeon]
MTVVQIQSTSSCDLQVKALLSSLRKKNITSEQEKVVHEIAQSLTRSITDKDMLKDALSTLEEIALSSKFKFEQLGLLKFIVDKTSNYSWSALYALSFIIESPHFNEKEWNVLEQLLKKAPGNVEAVLWEIESSVRSPAGRSWKLITFVLEKSQKENNPLKLLKSLNAIAENKDLNIKSVLEMYSTGEKLARELGASFNDPLVCVSFAYSISVIGEKKTRELYSKTGIEYFARYSKDMLKEVYSNLSKETKAPVLVVAFNKYDVNGVFYKEGRRLDSFLKSNYKILIFECASENEFYNKVESFAKNGKIHTLIIGGHGEPHKIMLGGNTDSARLDLGDEKELIKIKKHFIKNPKIILVACSTGKDNNSMGAVISRVMDATVFAPPKPDHTTEYVIGKDGLIKNVKYTGPTKKFLGNIPRKNE